VILGLLGLPFRLLNLLLLAGAVYLGWTYRAELRRWIHRATADSAAERVGPGAPARVSDPKAAQARAAKRLDSLAQHRTDSVVLPPDEVEGLVLAPLMERAAGAVDSPSVSLGEGELILRGQVDPTRLPPGTLGPLAQWIKGRETVEAKGALTLMRVGVAEWRVTDVKVHGLPLPRALWSKLLPPAGTVGGGSVTFPLEPWITGLRATPRGLVVYGGKVQR
jgi:hypothetical protein